MFLREFPEHEELMKEIDEVLSGARREFFLKLLWSRLFDDVPASHLRLQLKDKGEDALEEDDDVKVVVKVGPAIKFLPPAGSDEGFKNIENLEDSTEKRVRFRG